MQQDPSNALGLPMVATLPGETTLADLLVWNLSELANLENRLGAAFRDLNDVRAKLRNFKHIAEGGSPRPATDMGKGGE